MNNDMNNDLISRADLWKKVTSHTYPVDILENEHKVITEILRLIGSAPTALFPLTFRVVDKVTDENIETIKRLMKDYQPQIINFENEWIPITFRQANDEEYEKTCAVYDSYWADLPREECKVYNCRMPDDGQEVLITTSWGAVCEDTFHADDVLAGFEDHDDPDDVIAWMPKPKAYKKGEES